MRKLFILGILAMGSLIALPVGPTITVIPTLGPDFFTSGNFDAWAANVITGLRTNTTPGSGVTQYNPLANGATLNGNEFIISDGSTTTPVYAPFPSWQGMANPTGSFAAELGTVLYFSVKIIDSTASFNLADLMVTETYLGTAFGTSPVGGNYRATAVGIDGSGNVLDSGQAATTSNTYW